MTTLSLPSLRPATPADAERVFTWRNSPFILSRGSSQRAVTWEEHRQWFSRTITSPERLMLIVSYEDAPVGQVRFDQHDDQTVVVSIYLTAESVGRGLGVRALKQACWQVFAQQAIQRIVAFVRRDNPHSVRAFEKAGFARLQDAHGIEPPAEHIAFVLPRPERIPHNRLTHGLAEEQAVRETVRSGQWASGRKVAQLETLLAQMAGVKHAVCVASGLSALRLALKGLGVQSGQSVAVPAYSCVALANAVLACGAQPHAVDVVPDEWNCDPVRIENAATEQPLSALISVNTFGLPARIESLRHAGVPIIEDCAHAFGMEVSGQPLGSRADAAILSFYATKLIGAGEGGAVLTDSDSLAAHVRSWRDYTDQPPEGTRLNDKMTDVEASLALCQLDRLPAMIEQRRALADKYTAALGEEAARSDLFQLPINQLDRADRVWYRYAVRLQHSPAREVIRKLRQYGVCADEPVVDWRLEADSACPVADEAYERIVSLPLYPTLTDVEQERVIHAFIACCQEAAHV